MRRRGKQLRLRHKIMAEEKKPYTSIVDAFLDDREPDWKDLGLKDAQDSGEEQLDRSHEYVDEGFMDEIAESASRHTPLWPSRTGSVEKNAQKDRLERARGTQGSAHQWCIGLQPELACTGNPASGRLQHEAGR